VAVAPVILLAIESATDLVGVGLVVTGGGAAERSHQGGRAHAELLAPSIAEVCAVSGCTVADIDRIAVDIGPGLFTGLRVGVATAKAMAQASGIGVLGVSSLDVLAAAAAERLEGGHPEPVVSVVDARRGEVFAALYRFDRPDGAVPSDPPPDPESVRLDRLEPMTPESLVAWLLDVAVGGPRLRVVGDGAARYYPLLAAHSSLDLGWAGDLTAPPPLTLARLAERRLARGVPTVAASDLVPDYRRPADARINWEQRAPRVAATGVGPDGPR
jgi:tRNA threonylcarbamoyladenosine biosynthesis protein TsaB